MVAAASQDVEEWTAAQLLTVKSDIEKSRQHWQLELQRDKQTLLKDLQLDVTKHAVELGRHILEDLSDQSLQSRLAERFTSRLKSLDLSSLQAAIDRSSEARVTVVSSHQLPESDQSLIAKALMPLKDRLDFSVNPRLICGIELQAPDCRFTWSLQEALAEVESDLIDAIENTLPAASDAGLPGKPTDLERTTL
jgi:F-type H+-transporting ATPase subunit b